MAWHEAGLWLFQLRPFRPIHPGKQAGLASRGLHRPGSVGVCHLVVPFVLLKEPAARKGRPADGQYPAALGLDFISYAVLIDEMHNDPNRDSGNNGPKQNMRSIHTEAPRVYILLPEATAQM